jgi:light-harvesting protein B-800-850 alpha chain
VPLFLGACAIGSFAVHYALLTNTTWVKAFLNGNTKTVVAEGSAAGVPAAPTAKK